MFFVINGSVFLNLFIGGGQGTANLGRNCLERPTSKLTYAVKRNFDIKRNYPKLFICFLLPLRSKDHLCESRILLVQLECFFTWTCECCFDYFSVHTNYAGLIFVISSYTEEQSRGKVDKRGMLKMWKRSKMSFKILNIPTANLFYFTCGLIIIKLNKCLNIMMFFL